MKTKIIIDTDPGIDDAVAIFAALACEELQVELITTVAGNVSLEKTTGNALKLLHFAGKDVPVARGSAKPLLGPRREAAHVHGETGLRGYDFEETDRRPVDEHAVLAIRACIEREKSGITLVSIGPLTNIALLFSMYPECVGYIKRLVMMGGSTSRGNEAPMAEFNVLADPEAAKIVFGSGVELIMCGLDITNKCLLSEEDANELKNFNKTGSAVYGMFRHYRGDGENIDFKMHDSSAIAYLVKPELFKTRKTHIDVETKGILTYGCVVADLDGKLGLPDNATVCMDVDAGGFSRWLVDTLKKSV